MHTRGFSMIEILIVIAMLAIVVGFGVVMSYSSIARASVTQERDLLVTLLLSGARARAVANINESSHGVHIEADRYTLFEGTTYNASNPSNRDVMRNADITVTTSDGNDIVFERRSGDVLTGVNGTSGEGTISLTHEGKTISFELNKVGRINW